VAIDEVTGGTALTSIFKKETDPRPTVQRWIGKVGLPNGLLRNEIASIATRTLAEMNLDTICEKIAADLYKELGRGLFEVPKTKLTHLPVMDNFAQANSLAQAHVQQGITEALRIMSRFVTDYLDLAKIKTREGEVTLSFMDYLRKHHRPQNKS
jgi:hypothetical protein